MSVKILAPLAACLMLLVACGPPPLASGDGWRQTDRLDGGMINFVEIDKAHAQDGAAYRKAAEQICTPVSDCFQVGFFIEGQPSPAGQFGSRSVFFGNGGWGPWKPVAVFMGTSRRFTTWDCEKVGEKDAPFSALCGAELQAQHDAMLSLASRVGWTTGCGLPQTDDLALVEQFLALPSQAARRDNFRKAYDDMYEPSKDGPDDPANCVTLRPQVEADAREARAVLRKAIKAG
ncbi:hypothetical protein [Caulobacter segnis]